jgi:hypothetical protein
LQPSIKFSLLVEKGAKTCPFLVFRLWWKFTAFLAPHLLVEVHRFFSFSLIGGDSPLSTKLISLYPFFINKQPLFIVLLQKIPLFTLRKIWR